MGCAPSTSGAKETVTLTPNASLTNQSRRGTSSSTNNNKGPKDRFIPLDDKVGDEYYVAATVKGNKTKTSIGEKNFTKAGEAVPVPQ